MTVRWALSTVRWAPSTVIWAPTRQPPPPRWRHGSGLAAPARPREITTPPPHPPTSTINLDMDVPGRGRASGEVRDPRWPGGCLGDRGGRGAPGVRVLIPRFWATGRAMRGGGCSRGLREAPRGGPPPRPPRPARGSTVEPPPAWKAPPPRPTAVFPVLSALEATLSGTDGLEVGRPPRAEEIRDLYWGSRRSGLSLGGGAEGGQGLAWVGGRAWGGAERTAQGGGGPPDFFPRGRARPPDFFPPASRSGRPRP